MEITNTTMEMEIEEDTQQPIGFKPKTALPFEKISCKLKRPRASQCEEYIKLINRTVDDQKRQGYSIFDIVNYKKSPFLQLYNDCGAFKSAYAQNLINHVHLYNEVKKKVNPDYLDSHSKGPEAYII